MIHLIDFNSETDKNVLKCLLLFVKFDDFKTIIHNIKNISYFTFVNEYDLLFTNKTICLRELFNRFFLLLVDIMNGEFYKCLWILIHIFPLHMKHSSTFVQYFYKSFVITKLNCSICRSHYTMFLKSLDPLVFTNPDYLFEKSISLHDSVNSKLSGNTIVSDLLIMKQKYLVFSNV